MSKVEEIAEESYGDCVIDLEQLAHALEGVVTMQASSSVCEQSLQFEGYNFPGEHLSDEACGDARISKPSYTPELSSAFSSANALLSSLIADINELASLVNTHLDVARATIDNCDKQLSEYLKTIYSDVFKEMDYPSSAEALEYLGFVLNSLANYHIDVDYAEVMHSFYNSVKLNKLDADEFINFFDESVNVIKQYTGEVPGNLTERFFCSLFIGNNSVIDYSVKEAFMDHILLNYEDLLFKNGNTWYFFNEEQEELYNKHIFSLITDKITDFNFEDYDVDGFYFFQFGEDTLGFVNGQFIYNSGDLSRILNGKSEFDGFWQVDKSFLESTNYSVLLSSNGSYGVNQGVFRSLVEHYDDSAYIKYVLNGTIDIVRDYFPDMSDGEILSYLEKLDSSGACTHTGVVNRIAMYFADDQERFKEIFGYDLYRGGGIINGEYLLADFYSFVNQDNERLFDIERDADGNVISRTYKNPEKHSRDSKATEQLFLDFLNYKAEQQGGKYLIDATPNQKIFIYKNGEFRESEETTDINYNNSITDVGPYIAEGIKNGSLYEIGTAGDGTPVSIYFYDSSTDTFRPSTYDCGHTMAVVDADDHGLYVLTWGKLAYIPNSSLEGLNWTVREIDISVKEV